MFSPAIMFSPALKCRAKHLLFASNASRQAWDLQLFASNTSRQGCNPQLFTNNTSRQA